MTVSQSQMWRLQNAFFVRPTSKTQFTVVQNKEMKQNVLELESENGWQKNDK